MRFELVGAFPARSERVRLEEDREQWGAMVKNLKLKNGERKKKQE